MKMKATRTDSIIAKLVVTATLVLLVIPQCQAQELELPECDIFLFELTESDGNLAISDGKNITDRPGYDNQPWFSSGNKSILFTANHQSDRTDVFEYFIESGETRQVTDTPTQEYSPQASPDNQVISFVTDGETANQSVWFTRRGSDKEEWLLANQGQREPVGYYSWNRESGYILYWSRYGYSLRLVHETKSLSHYVTGHAPPSTPRICPTNGRFTFLHQQGNGEIWIKELDPQTLAIRPLTPITGNGRNYAWTPDGSILMPVGNELNRWKADSDDGWSSIANLGELGISNVTRVAVSPDGSKLAIVGLANPPQPQ